MKKKIIMGLGSLAAIAAPVAGVIACNDEEKTIADKMSNMFPAKITVPITDKSKDGVVELKKLTTDNQVIEEKAPTENVIRYIQRIVNLENKAEKLAKDDKDFKVFYDAAAKKNSKLTFDWKVKKGFAENKIILTLEIKAVDIKPQLGSRGTASKDIEIIFATE